MKQKIYLYGLLTVLIIVIGTIFKINHMPGAGIMITFGIISLVLIFIPASLINNYRSGGNRQNLILYIITWITCLITFTAMLFKVQHWPFAGTLLTIALPFPYVVFLPVFLLITSKNKSFNTYNTVFVLFLLALNSVFSCLLALNVSKVRIDESYNLSGNYNRIETVLRQISNTVGETPVTRKIDTAIKIVNDYRGKILKGEGFTNDQWKNEPQNLWRPDARGVAANSIHNPDKAYPGEELQVSLNELIKELEKNPDYDGLAKSASSIFSISQRTDESDSSIQEIFTSNTLSWSLMYLDGLEANLTMLKSSI